MRFPFRGFWHSPVGRAGKAVGGAAAGAAAIGWGIGQVDGLLNRLSPTAINTVTVTIVGLPNANLNNLYQAAISIGAGVLAWRQAGDVFVEGFPFNSTHTAQSKIDYINKTVTVMIGYAQQGWIQALLPTVGSGGLVLWSGPAMFNRPINDPVEFFNYPTFIQYGANIKGPVIPSANADDLADGVATAITSDSYQTVGLPNPGWNGSGAFGPGTAVPAPVQSTCKVPPTSGTTGAGNYTPPSTQTIQQVIRNLFAPTGF